MTNSKLTQTYCLIFICFLFVNCGGGDTAREEETTSSENSSGEDESVPKEEVEEIEVCFHTEGFTHVFTNLKVKGEEVEGLMNYTAPKAGMSLYAHYNVKGTRKGEKLELEFTLADNETGQEIGKKHKEVWLWRGEKLIAEEQAKNGEDPVVIGGIQNKSTCENMPFTNQIVKTENWEEDLQFEGAVNGNLKVYMFLTARNNPKDKREIFYKGYYYYESQGADKKISLKGKMVDYMMAPMYLTEIADGKEFGSFIIPMGTDLEDEFICTWVSADGKKELETVLRPK